MKITVEMSSEEFKEFLEYKEEKKLCLDKLAKCLSDIENENDAKDRRSFGYDSGISGTVRFIRKYMGIEKSE